MTDGNTVVRAVDEAQPVPEVDRGELGGRRTGRDYQPDGSPEKGSPAQHPKIMTAKLVDITVAMEFTQASATWPEPGVTCDGHGTTVA